MESTKDFKRFAELMSLLSAAMGVDVSTERMDIYFQFLNDFEINEIARAVYHLIKTEKFPTFPTIGKIRTLIEGDAREAMELEANASWAKVCKLYINRVYVEGDIRDGIITEKRKEDIFDEVIKIAFGDWEHFGAVNKPLDEVANRRHLINCYRGIARKEAYKLIKPTETRKQLKN